MAYLQSIAFSNQNPVFDENLWIINIRRSLEEELENDTEVPASIFNVPKTLMTRDPVSYTPQQVAIGPYHRWHPELYEMERFKLAAAKRTQKQLQDLKFHHLVDHLNKLETKIRSCYHKFLDFSDETLAWMMAIDASFLLEFLQIYALKEGMNMARTSSRMSHLVDYTRRKSAHNAILRDMVMLENQMPLFVLRKMLEVQHSSLELADEILLSMLIGFCKEISPFKMMQDAQQIPISRCSHLLDYLYNMIVPKVEAPLLSEITEALEDQEESMLGREAPSTYSGHVKDLFSEIWKILSNLRRGPVQLVKKLLCSRILKLILKLPWTILSNLPGFSILKQPVQRIFFAEDKEEIKPENGSSSNEVDNPPLVEEITIPCVNELYKCGVRFVPTNGNISGISFDAKNKTFYIPMINLDVNTEVVLRNLVAYEATNASGPLIFTRYTELMNGIIDTDEDVKLLREKGIILNRLNSDREVADLWNGMSKSIKLTKVPHLDKVIEDINKYYNARWKIKIGNFTKRYVFGSWQFLTLLAAIFLLLLMTLQAFCQVYSCTRIFHINTNSSFSQVLHH